MADAPPDHRGAVWCPVPVYGDGSAQRDFTYVGDVAAANLAAADGECAPNGDEHRGRLHRSR